MWPCNNDLVSPTQQTQRAPGEFHSPQGFLGVPPGSYSHSCALPRHTVDTGNFDVNHNLSLTGVVDNAVTCAFLRLSDQVLQHPTLSIAPCQKGTTQPMCVFCKGHREQKSPSSNSYTTVVKHSLGLPCIFLYPQRGAELLLRHGNYKDAIIHTQGSVSIFLAEYMGGGLLGDTVSASLTL